jgi:toxin YoeB
MRLVFTPRGWSDHRYWQTHDRLKVRRLDYLLESTKREPFCGVGDPVPLRHVLGGCWSRRIDGEHRLVYLVEGDDVVVLQARTHYESEA